MAQRVYGLALGYEDLNDHEELRNDPLLAVLVEKEGPDNQVLAGKSTLNRLELSGEKVREKERYKKIVLDHGAVDRLLVEVFLQAHREEPKEIILDRTPLTIRCTGSRKDVSSMATMDTTATCRCTSSAESFCCVPKESRSSNIDASSGSVEEMDRIVAQIGPRGPRCVSWCVEIRDFAARS